MSNYQAIATVTAVLQRVLQSAVQTDVDGVRVTTIQPRNIGNGTPETGINLFLYHVTRNPALNNADATPFRSKGTPIKRQAALDLYYIVNLYGNDTELEPQRLLGSVVRTFNDYSTLKSEAIQEALRDPTYRFLSGSNLADQIQQLLIVPLDLSLEDLSKIWSVFFQAPYLLSLIYKVTAVLIDGEESLPRALPVSDRYLGGVAAFPNRPVIEQVIAATSKLEPILLHSTLHICGRHFKSDLVQVRIGGFEVSPSEVRENLIVLPLQSLPFDCLRAGTQALQVIHRIPTNQGTTNHQYSAVESNVAPFVLRPTIQQIGLENQNQNTEELRCAILSIQVDVMVGMKQRAVLVMNEWSTNNSLGYQFEAMTREVDTDTIIFVLQDVKPAEYLLRVQIDGAESLLNLDTDETSPTFNWYHSPKVEIE